MKIRDKDFSIGMTSIILSWLIFSLLISEDSLPSLNPNSQDDIQSLPNFSSFKNTQKKKDAFFNFLYPIAIEENLFLLDIRNQLGVLKNKTALEVQEINWLMQLKSDYFIESEDTVESIDQLLKRVDVIPPSLILAQAAIESGWGTSRFAKKANNLFGHWCFSKGCGLVPSSRDNGKAHEVAKFDSVNESIRSYLKNLNSFHRYQQFRLLRSQSNIKEAGDGVLKLIPGLKAYSEQGEIYIKKVQNLIKHNKLQKFDRRFVEQLNKK
tara:strand:+ start:13000 stop:13800 length:801 start_codon:yes stop_codon:yes gene_type:complete